MNGSNPAPDPDPQSSRPNGDRLDSWKEIAVYLRRDESTVRRWEKDGLPVHRHRHKFRAAVYAYKSELDIWWNNGLRETSSSHAVVAGMPGPGIRRRRLTLNPARLTLVLFAVAALAVGAYWAQRNLAREVFPPKTIMLAVLPLQNLSGNPDEEYFSDGLTEELITQLGRLQPDRLGVIARTTTMQYKTTTKRVDEIGRELKVDYVLEGSVRRDGEEVRISVQLIRTNDQTHVWAENYQREAREILALQSQVASAVARQISLKLSTEKQTELASVGPVSPAAHELYLRGRYLWNQRTEESLQRSITYFQDAITQDPSYAAAYAAIADAFNVSGNWGLLPPKQAYPQAKAAATRALEINPRLAEAHIALAYVLHLHDWDSVAAEKEFQQGLKLNPNYAPGHQWYAVFLASQGRFEEAIAEITRAQQLDPLSRIIGDVVGWIYSLARQNDRAIEEFRKAVELDPNFYPTHYDLGMTYADVGRHQEAIDELEKARSLSGDTERTVSGLAYAYALAGQKAKARKLLEDLHQRSKRRYVPAFDIAVIYAALGEKDLAFAYLEKAYDDRHPWLIMFRVTPKVDPLRSDPRFEKLCQRVGLSP